MSQQKLTVFGHVYKVPGDRTSLRSVVLVEDLLDTNRDVFAVGVQLTTEKDLEWHSGGVEKPDSEEVDKRRVLWSICCNIDSLKEESGSDTGYHCGDCTWVACSCSRCLAESLYRQGEEVLKSWKEIRGSEDAIELLAVLLATQHEWVTWRNIIKEQVQKHIRNSDRQKRGETEREDPTEGQDTIDGIHIKMEIKHRHERWLEMPKEDKDNFTERAKAFRHYFDERPVVDGIPWW